ncbi:hypothetical protein GLOIN_2v1626783 [Rhizophagus irregularis DAOM 181602=DAOM 197198]|uniref:Uncharacterized protein n=1 Tax=Rhizophagus irregularis (strain DAOM 181602 / DAOM 197198 / MUCL 43194) TaxID=747089 RepID=A0A2P4PVL9_RHIID|nr:hypothetical protein GLOIN_2v1626783 [Rhizophagus irregularis DAOM 181602=DAOM 197198]POG69449.1 hypothetical protein GLOIN_2v1626783 [Rhizophagus irregularis DAOM 181602=DAOM 197198]|eukprot:XP_025176315.1 hypothetical protein GLOIN_2v1626783 [Rhizophagus irregularis DAOM 181602=DAOM 197198]
MKSFISILIQYTVYYCTVHIQYIHTYSTTNIVYIYYILVCTIHISKYYNNILLYTV